MLDKRKKEHLIFGIFFIVFGAYILFQEGDFVISRGAPVSKIFLGFTGLFFGSMSLLFYVLKKPSSVEYEYVKCTQCGHPFYKKDTKGGICEKCGGHLEDMDNYYQRSKNPNSD